MSHLHYASLPKGKNRRSAATIPPRHEAAIAGKTRGRVVVFEAASTARDIIRVYVETIDEAWQERVIAF